MNFRLWSWVRIVGAALIFSAVAAQLIRSVHSPRADGTALSTVVVNFFSFFTIDSNVSSAVVLLWLGILGVRRGDRMLDSRPQAVALSCVTTYMIITGVVYNLLLRSVELPQGATVLWANEVLHVVGPLILLADLFLGPGRRRLPWSAAGAVLVFPLVWVVYTMLRGPHVRSPLNGDLGWYPYPFLDPSGSGGVASVVAYIAVITVAFAVVAAFVVWVGRHRAVRSETAAG